MRPPSPRRPGGRREQPSAVTDAAGDEPDVGEATPASSRRVRPGKGSEEHNPREGTQRSAREGFAQRRTRERGGEKSSREEARERRARARAERAAREQGEERHSRAVERRTTRGVLATPVAAADAATLLGSEETTDLGDRLRERTRARRMLLLRRIAVSVVTVALVVGVGWLAFFSPLFALSTGNIQVTGEDGTLVTVDSVRSSVQENVAVKSASVSRRWPTSLKVSVTMRAGIAVEAAEGTYWLVDDQGVRFERVSSVGGYPLVTLSGDRAAGASDVASMLGALDQSTRSQVSAITSTGTQVNFTLRGGQTVKWGTSGDAPQKARVLATLLANVKATTYDVSAPNHPVTS